jgi:hypothetical protein
MARTKEIDHRWEMQTSLRLDVNSKGGLENEVARTLKVKVRFEYNIRN